MAKKDLVQIIRDNPGCVAVIDNDCWYLYKQSPWLDDDGEEIEGNELANDRSIKPIGDGGYGSGNCYGGDILQALAIIVGMEIESV